MNRDRVVQDVNYVLGPGDEISIWALEAEELNSKGVHVDNSGTINIPLLGRVPAQGLTVSQLEADLVQRARRFIRNPQLGITVTEYRSQPVSVIGAVNTPGVAITAEYLADENTWVARAREITATAVNWSLNAVVICAAAS